MTLWNKDRAKRCRVHRLVLLAFAPKGESGSSLALHRDDCKDNNKLENLYWGTHGQNERDAMRNGVKAKGERHPMVTLSESQVREIFARAGAGESYRSLAAEFRVSRFAIYAIRNGRTWRHLGLAG